MDPAMAPMSPTITNKLESLWELWDIRLVVTSSLFIQAVLLFLGPSRKRTFMIYINFPLWLSYFLSTTISTYGLQLINKSSKEIHSYNNMTSINVIGDNGLVDNPSILALWSSFLLLFTGGPDTITAFSMEDNDQWYQQFFNLIPYFYFIISSTKISLISTPYMFPTAVIILCVGLLRYCIWAKTLLFSRNVGKEGRVPEIIWLKPTTTGQETSGLTELQVLQHAYTWFTQFRGLIFDYRFNFKNCITSREFFLKLTPKQAFRILERELNFFYEFLYTKPWVANKMPSYILKLAEFFCLWIALLLFFLAEKKEFMKIDTIITYLLLLGSILLDASNILIILNTDWSIKFLESGGGVRSSRLGKKLKNVALTLTRTTTSSTWSKNIANRRWSNSVSQFNLISHSLHPSMASFGPDKSTLIILSNMLEEKLHVETVKFDKDMRNLIIEQLQNNSQQADNPRTASEIQSAWGHWILSTDVTCSPLIFLIKDFDFDQCLLMWHIATELCFHTDYDVNNGHEESKNVTRNLSKHLSDYLLYLLIWQPQMISTLSALGGERFQELVYEFREYSSSRNIKMIKGVKRQAYRSILKLDKGEELKATKQACESILLGCNTVRSDAYASDERKCGLFEARTLALELNKLGDKRKWEVLWKVWVEMLCYAASHCEGIAHMAQLKQGGELITFVWLLMVHFGLVS